MYQSWTWHFIKTNIYFALFHLCQFWGNLLMNTWTNSIKIQRTSFLLILSTENVNLGLWILPDMSSQPLAQHGHKKLGLKDDSRTLVFIEINKNFDEISRVKIRKIAVLCNIVCRAMWSAQNKDGIAGDLILGSKSLHYRTTIYFEPWSWSSYYNDLFSLSLCLECS